MKDFDASGEIIDQLNRCRNRGGRLRIQGKGSKAIAFSDDSELLDISSHSGVIAYDPAELMIRVRAGTDLRELEALLAAEGQYLAFEPMQFDGKGTIGGAVASGLAGPGRPVRGSARDHVLGVTLLNADGQILSLGGQVMKNVAGYDISRLMAGSWGTLGVLLDISLRVLPLPDIELTSVLDLETDSAMNLLAGLRRSGAPLTASLYDGRSLYMRFSGHARRVEKWHVKTGSDRQMDNSIWERERKKRYDTGRDKNTARNKTLFCLNLPITADSTGFDDHIVDWLGLRRWVSTDMETSHVYGAVRRMGGYAQPLLHSGVPDPFSGLDAVALKFHQRLKMAFDPLGLFESPV